MNNPVAKAPDSYPFNTLIFLPKFSSIRLAASPITSKFLTTASTVFSSSEKESKFSPTVYLFILGMIEAYHRAEDLYLF
jgi:hypothetical protein